VAREASALLDVLVPQAQKSDVIATLLPYVEKPGDAERGRHLFTGACGACHRLGDVGTGGIGPPLNGMGAHGRAELLAHIIDPNREVDPSFWQWNVTTKSGQTLAGVIVSESSAGLTLRTEGGDVVLKKEEIASRENTRRSLMPEGLEALGSDVLRDILAFMAADDDERFRIIDLRHAYTADSRRGLRREEERDETVTLHRFGDVSVSGVPFFVMDPARSTTGLNLIALRSGAPRGDALDDLPERVEIPAGVTAASLHFLGGVGGWAWPHGGDAARGKPVMRVTVHFADGSTEEHVLRNGEHVADFDGHADVPLSTNAGDFTRRGQLRYVAIDLKKARALSKIVLESVDATVVPATVAITASAEPVQRGASAPRSTSDAPRSPSDAPRTSSSAQRSASDAVGRADDDGTLRGVGGSVTQATGTTARVDVPGLQPSAGDSPSAVQGAAGPREGGKGDAPLPETRPIVWEPGKTKVVIIAGGSAHEFGKHFGETDSATLTAAGLSVHYTEDRDQAVEALGQADVAVISVNRQFFDTPAYRKAVFDFAAAGRGIVMLHPGTWYAYPDWPELNALIVGGGARGHDRVAAFSVNAVKPDHPVMRGVPESFEVEDELYYVNADAEKIPPGTAPIEVLAETSPSVKFKRPHPSVWTTTHPSARIVSIALGHDERVHEHEAFRTLLVNAVRWAGRVAP
jgi:uncharacterized protein